ncbi:putative aryl-alcohol dehydrogenase aad14 [Botryosphaeria dothidea]
MSEIFKPAPEPPTELGRYRILSSTAGIRVSPLQLGAMSIGDAWAGVLGSMDKDQAFKLLDTYFDAGGNFIDTANNYHDPRNGSASGSRSAASATKYTSDYRSYKLGKGRTPNTCGNHKRSLHTSVRDSLRKLKTDWIDILYLHWWDHTTSIEEVVDSLHVLVEQGKVLYLGISDTPAWVVSAANMYAKAHGKTQFSIYQGRWNVMLRDFEREIIPMARQFGMALAPWDVLGGGHFQTKEAMEERKKKGEGIRSLMGAGQSEEEVKISEALSKVAGEHGIKSVTAVALAYVMAKTTNVFPIVGGRKVEHLQDNIQALKIKLTQEQIDYLESVKSFEPGFPSNFVGEDPRVGGQAPPLTAAAAQMDFVRYPKPIGHE